MTQKLGNLSLTYATYGRIAVLGHSPYVMTPPSFAAAYA